MRLLNGLKCTDSNSNVIKVRAVNSDTKCGKSNGYRIIYYAIKDDGEVFLLTVYCKKDDKNVPSKQEIINLVDKYIINMQNSEV